MNTQMGIMCDVCGRAFKNEHGLKVHKYRSHTPKGKKHNTSKLDEKRTTTSNSTMDNKLSLNIPCQLGGNDFEVTVVLGIEATTINQPAV